MKQGGADPPPERATQSRLWTAPRFEAETAGTLFHLGTLWRLNELKLLRDLKEITSVSGGWITSGWLGLRWKMLTLHHPSARGLHFIDLIVNPLRQFCSRTCDCPDHPQGVAEPLPPPTYLAQHSREPLVRRCYLQDLPSSNEGPRIHDLRHECGDRCQRPYDAEAACPYLIGEIPNRRTPLATAASTGPTPIHSAEVQDQSGSLAPVKVQICLRKIAYRRAMYLGDGCVY